MLNIEYGDVGSCTTLAHDLLTELAAHGVGGTNLKRMLNVTSYEPVTVN